MRWIAGELALSAVCTGPAPVTPEIMKFFWQERAIARDASAGVAQLERYLAQAVREERP